MRAVVVGGGLAGISCALDLADRGHQVSLLERAPQLGGLCRSVSDPVAGRVDTGQHVYLGSCTALERFLDRIGTRPSLRQGRLGLVVVDSATGAARSLAAAPLPAPLHLLPVLLGWPGLGPWVLPQAARLAAALRHGDHRQLDSVPARSWLESLGQGEEIIKNLWEPFLVSSCNVGLERCSAALAAFVIGQGLLSSASAGAIRVPGTDLTGWLHPPAERALLKAGVTVRLRARAIAVRRLGADDFEVPDAAGATLQAELVVLATAAAQASHLLTAGGLADQGLDGAAQLPDSPIVNVHVFTDRPFLPGPIVVVPRSPLQWLFDRSAIDPDEREPLFHSAISLSAATAEIGTPEDELAQRMWRLCQRTFPAAARARLLHARVTREAHATFAAGPGSRARRPGPRSELPGLLLAGSWTDTGWPATMEGAVRSGLAAAAGAGLS
ncbi:MAG: hydroxysqualene dehydroxylase HpnE [Candidatus Dormibacteria bacterium]